MPVKKISQFVQPSPTIELRDPPQIAYQFAKQRLAALRPLFSQADSFEPFKRLVGVNWHITHHIAGEMIALLAELGELTLGADENDLVRSAGEVVWMHSVVFADQLICSIRSKSNDDEMRLLVEKLKDAICIVRHPNDEAAINRLLKSESCFKKAVSNQDTPKVAGALFILAGVAIIATMVTLAIAMPASIPWVAAFSLYAAMMVGMLFCYGGILVRERAPVTNKEIAAFHADTKFVDFAEKTNPVAFERFKTPFYRRAAHATCAFFAKSAQCIREGKDPVVAKTSEVLLGSISAKR